MGVNFRKVAITVVCTASKWEFRAIMMEQGKGGYGEWGGQGG